MKSSTPHTDAAEKWFFGDNRPGMEIECVRSEFARTLEIAITKAREEYLDQCAETASVREERDQWKVNALAAYKFIGELQDSNLGVETKCENFLATAIAANA